MRPFGALNFFKQLFNSFLHLPATLLVNFPFPLLYLQLLNHCLFLNLVVSGDHLHLTKLLPQPRRNQRVLPFNLRNFLQGVPRKCLLLRRATPRLFKCFFQLSDLDRVGCFLLSLLLQIGLQLGLHAFNSARMLTAFLVQKVLVPAGFRLEAFHFLLEFCVLLF